MNKIRSKFNLPLFLRITEVLLTTLMLFPVIYSCTIFTSKNGNSDLGHALFYTFLFLGMSVFFFMLSKIPPFSFKSGNAKLKVISAICKVLILLATFILFFSLLKYKGLAFCVLAVVSVFFGLFNSFCSISFLKLFYYALINVLQFLFFFLYNQNRLSIYKEDFELLNMKVSFNSNANIWFFLFFFIVVMFYNNQTNITKLMDRRGHDQKSMPKEMRTYNLFLVSVISFIAVILVTLKSQFSMILSYVLGVFKTIATFIVQKIFELTADNNVVDPNAEITKDDVGGIAGATNTSEYGDFIASLAFILIATLIICYIFSRRKYILMAIIEAIENFKRKISELFKSTKVVDKSIHAEGGEFTDHIVSIKDEVIGTGLKKYKKRDWNKEFKTTIKIENETEKYFHCYNLVLKWLKLNGYEAKTGDTPLEIYNATLNIIGSESWKISTEDYNALMYKEEDVSPKNIELLCNYLRQQKT